MDAMTHAIEGYVSTDWSPHQDARSLQALRMIRDNLERAVERGEQDEEARGNMLVAANLAITIALGSVHAMSHPAGAHFGVPHGVANAIHLPHVIRHNAAGGAEIADRYRDIGDVFGIDDPDIGEALAAYLTELMARLGPADPPVGGRRAESGIPALVEGAMGDGTTLLNPREMGEEDYAALHGGSCSRAAAPGASPRAIASSVASPVCLGARAAASRASVFISTGLRTEWSQATESGISGRRVATSAVASTSSLGIGTEYQPSASARSDIVSVPPAARL